MPETIKSLANVLHLETTEVVLIHSNTVSNDYQQDSEFLHAFFPNKSFCKLLDIHQKCLFLKNFFDSKFLYIEVWIADQNSKLLVLQDKVNITLAINYNVKHKKWWDIEFNLEVEYL